MAAKKIQIGETGRAVASNIAITRARMRPRLTVAELAERIQQLGRPITRQALSDIEAERRRVDVDDLVAIAAALGVSPATLLMPETFDETEVEPVLDGLQLPAGILWSWLTAEHPLDVPEPTEQYGIDVEAFKQRAKPRWVWAREQ